MMMFTTFKLRSFVIAVAACMAFSSCSEDNEDDTPSYNVPETYDFENVSYSGQTQRMQMLSELDAYIKTGNNGESLSAQTMKQMYANVNAPFADASLNSSGKQLRDKTIATAQADFEGYFDAVAAASNAPPTCWDCLPRTVGQAC